MKRSKILIVSLILFLIGFVTIDESFASDIKVIVNPDIIPIKVGTVLSTTNGLAECATITCYADQDIWYGISTDPSYAWLEFLDSSTTTLNTKVVGNYTVTYTAYHTLTDYSSATRTYIVYDPAGTTTTSVTEVGGDDNPGGCNNCEAPTLGINSKTIRIVENGFTYNGKSVDAERYYTPYPLITVNIGEQNTAVFRIYEDIGPQNIGHFSFAFGLDIGQIIGESKAMIELDIDYDGTETVTVTDPKNALEDVNVSTHVENCNDDGNEEKKCLIVTIHHIFRAPLGFNIVATDVWDMERNAWQNYFNHGIEGTGESLNPPKEYSGISKGHIYHLTETSETTAIDEFGNSWTFNNTWLKDYVLSEKIKDPPTNVMTREHSDFSNYKQSQIDAAILTLLQSCPSCLESYADFESSLTFDYPNRLDKLDDPNVQLIMDLENDRAQEILNNIVDPLLYKKVKD